MITNPPQSTRLTQLQGRALLRKVALGLVAFVPAARALTTTVESLAEKLVRGRIVAVLPDSLIVATIDRGEIILQLRPETQIWEGRFVKDIAPAIGEEITGWVRPTLTKMYLAERLWINWATVQGRVTSVCAAGVGLLLECRQPDSRTTLVRVDPQTQITTATHNADFEQWHATLSEGERVQLIGRRLADGSLLAVTLSLPNH